MASIPFTLNCSAVSLIRASSGSSRRPDPNCSKTPSSAWWAPLFGWSSDFDYVNAGASFNGTDLQPEALASESAADRPRSRFALGGFTEEKAKQLRKKTAESSSFHDVMYHSAIAPRLASDVPEK